MSEETDGHSLIDDPITNAILVALFVIAFLNITSNINKSITTRYIGIIMCFLYTMYYFKTKVFDPFTHSVMFPCLIILALCNIFENHEPNLLIPVRNTNSDEISF
jgi:hypothetical protein